MPVCRLLTPLPDPLADALQDAYLALLMERALAVPGQSVESTPQPWNTEER